MTRITTIAAAVLTWSIAVHASTPRPNVILIVSDDQRPDTIHSLGATEVDTPTLDHLAARGTAFSRAYATYPICHVSRAQIMTGCHAFRALPAYPGGVIDPKLPTLAGTFQKAGYFTAYSGKWHNDGHPLQRGYTITSGLYSAGGAKGKEQPAVDSRGHPLTGYRGWTFKDADNNPELDKGIGLMPDNSKHIADGAIAALRSAPAGKPFLLHVNFAFPHDPRQWPVGMVDRYSPEHTSLPASFAPQHPFDHGNINGRDELLLPRPLDATAVKEELAIYHAMIADVDANVGRILQALREAGHEEDTIIVFTSDQGLALGSHGLLGKQNQYEHSIRSPLIITGPGLPANKRTEALACLNDIFPTLCDLTHMPVPSSVEGVSLVPLLRHQQGAAVHEYVIGCFTDSQRMICDQHWKLIEYPLIGRQQLFDLSTDPDELHDLIADDRHGAERRRLHEQLSAWLREHHDPNLK